MAKKDDRKAVAEKAREVAKVAERRERNIRIVGTFSVLLVIAGIFAVVLTQRSEDAPTDGGTIPAAVDQATGAYTRNPDTSATSTMDMWEDFQCPGCGAFETTYGSVVDQLILEDVVKVVVHPAAFLDRNLPGEFSTKATSAWGCALEIDEDKAWEFRHAIFAGQPQTEGDGWTNQQFRQFAEAVGFAGDDLPALTQCFSDVAHAKWAAVGTETFFNEGISSTPTIVVDGETVPDEIIKTGPSAFYNWVKEKAGK